METLTQALHQYANKVDHVNDRINGCASLLISSINIAMLVYYPGYNPSEDIEDRNGYMIHKWELDGISWEALAQDVIEWITNAIANYDASRGW